LVVNGLFIAHSGTLTPFFKKFGIPVDDEGDTKARDWREWQKAHGYLKEAFRAGNRARKKETAQDTVGTFGDLLITPDRVRDCIGTDIESVEKMCANGSWRKLINGLLSEVFEKPHSNVDTYIKHENGVSISTYYYTGRESHIMVSGNNGYVMRLRVDGEGHPEKFTVGITFYDRGVRCLRSRGGDKEYETVLERDNQWRGDGYEFNDGGLLMFCQFLSTGIVPAGFAVEDVVLDEAFRAGNRARKKEAIQDTVESVDSMQAQIDRFEKQTGLELEIRDGRPYFDGYLSLAGCTGLTSLPTGLRVGKSLYLAGCTELTSLPAGLEVEGTLNLRDCTGLTSLPAGLEVGGSLNLRGCTGLTSLPFDLVVQGEWIVHKGILKSFFRKLGIPVDDEGDTKAEDWREWQKAHGYLTEAFRAGNKARKKEAMQDTVESIDNNKIQAQIDRFREQTGKELEIRDGHPYYDGDLWLGGYTRLTSLPAGLEVNGNLDIGSCPDLTSLPAGLKVRGGLRLDDSGLSSLPSDLVVKGNWIVHKGMLTPFFKKLGIPVEKDGDTKVSYWREWQKANGYLTEAFRAGNKARKKEAMQDAAAVTDSVNLSFMDTIGEIESFLCRRGEKEDRVVTAEGDAIDSGKWFDWRGRTEDCQALVIEVENIDDDTCNVYVYIDATGVPSTFDATGRHRRDFECTGSLSNRAVLNNVLNIFDRLAGPAGEDELPEDLREGDENWEIYNNLIQRHADFLRPFLCRQDLDRLIADGILDEAFRAGNRARKKESLQDTAESADRPVTFDEIVREIERCVHRTGSGYRRNPHTNLYSIQRPDSQSEIFHIHPFSVKELTDNDVSRDGIYPGGWPEKVAHSYDAVVDLAYFPELDRTFVMICANVCTVDPNDIRRMSVFNSAGSYSEYYMGGYTDKDPLRDAGDYDLIGSEFFYPVDTISDLGKILEVVTYMLTDRKWLACMALFTVCRSFSSQYTRSLLPGVICPYIRKDLRISPEALHSAVNGALWNELLIRSNGLCGAIVDGGVTYKEILDMFEPDEYRSESGQPKVPFW